MGAEQSSARVAPNTPPAAASPRGFAPSPPPSAPSSQSRFSPLDPKIKSTLQGTSPDQGIVEVTLTKGDRQNVIGLTLSGDEGPPVILDTSPGGTAALTQRLRPGIKVLEVNGMECKNHQQATDIIVGASGNVTFKLQIPEEDENSA